MNWKDKACPFAIHNLIKIEISKMMALRDNLVYLLILFLFLFDQT